MEKIESLKKQEIQTTLSTLNLSYKILVVLKLILGLCLLPFVYSSSVSFLNEFTVIDKDLQNYFWQGVITFLIFYLFIWQPNIIYLKGQRILEIIFSFFRPFIKIAPYLLPIYTIILFFLYMVLSLLFSNQYLINIFIFLFGFSIGLHLVFSARSIKAKQNDPLKTNYIFGFSLIYIINLGLLSFLFNFIFKDFSFVNFCNNSLQISRQMFNTIFQQLFLKK
ncbi:MAG: hypothetical protein NC912_04450 [Candidatus Omnitrophica bacterium]|nr:hypothetical protein [Candidatus Omnitrophota bacterium]